MTHIITGRDMSHHCRPASSTRRKQGLRKEHPRRSWRAVLMSDIAEEKEEVVPEILIIGGGFAGVRACASIENGSVV